MNNNLLLQAQKWLAELGVKSEATQTVLKINRQDVYELGMFNVGTDVNTALFITELKDGVNKKLYLDNSDKEYFYLNSF